MTARYASKASVFFDGGSCNFVPSRSTVSRPSTVMPNKSFLLGAGGFSTPSARNKAARKFLRQGSDFFYTGNNDFSNSLPVRSTRRMAMR